MARKVNTTRLGVFVLCAAAIAVAAVGLFGSGRMFKRLQKYVIFFPESTRGLSLGSPVRFRGVPIGTVVDMQAVYLPTEERFVTPVYIEIDRQRIRNLGVAATSREEQESNMARVGLRAQLSTDSMVTGQRSIALDIKPDSALTLVGVDSSVTEIGAVPSPLEEISNTVEKLPLQEIADRLNATLDAAHSTLVSPEFTNAIKELGPTITEVKVTLSALSKDLKPLLAGINTKVQAMDVDKVIEKLDASLISINTAAANISTLASQGKPLAQDANETMRQVTAAARELRQVAEMLQRRPEVLLTGKR
jgi:paraquat-inducible protein B